MTQKLFGLCAACALLFAFATVNVASAEEKPTAANGCTCGCACCTQAAAPCSLVQPCCPLVTYRLGPCYKAVRPVVYVPAYRPVYVQPRYVYAPVSYRVCPPYYYVW